jgi:hypothetical protein
VEGACADPPGIGKGLGTAPVDAHAADAAASASVTTASHDEECLRLIVDELYRRQAAGGTPQQTNVLLVELLPSKTLLSGII